MNLLLNLAILFTLKLSDEFEAVIAPGVTTGEMMKECLAKGACLESDVILPSVTYGGILTTGCHVSTVYAYAYIINNLVHFNLRCGR